MFTWLNKQGVSSDEGFEVQSTGRFTIEYWEGGRVVTVPVEPGSFGGTASISIPKDAFARWNGSRSENPQQEQARLRANFVAAMSFQDIAVEP